MNREVFTKADTTQTIIIIILGFVNDENNENDRIENDASRTWVIEFIKIDNLTKKSSSIISLMSFIDKTENPKLSTSCFL